MEAKILFKNEEDGVIYYMIKYKDSKIPIRYSRDELIKIDRKLVEKYEKNCSIPFINKKRKLPENNDENDSQDNSSEETKHIHRYNKINHEENFFGIQNKKLNINQSYIIQNNNINKEVSNMNNIKENINNNKNLKNYIRSNKLQREGYLSNDIPLKIINVGYKNRSERKLYCLVEWKQQENIRILDSVVECEKIREKYPYLLLDFYESKLIFLDGD